MKPNNETERLLNATDDELDAMQYITASKIIHLKNKYKEPELRILWERAYAKRMINSMQEKLHIYEHGYKYAVPITVVLGILAAFTGWIWDFYITISSTFVFAIGSLLLFNLYMYGKAVLLFQKSKEYKDDKQVELESTILEHYKPAKNEEEGEWVAIKEVADRFVSTTSVIGKILKNHGFFKRRDSKNTYFLAKKTSKT